MEKALFPAHASGDSAYFSVIAKLHNENLIDCNTEQPTQQNKVIQRRKALSTLPLVNGLYI